MNEDHSSKAPTRIAQQAEVNRPREYIPNHISLDTRAWYFVVSSLMLAYAISSLVRDDFYLWIPGGRRRASLQMHLHGLSAWIASAAVFCASANLISVIVDHYDKRNNERNYRLFAKIMFIAAIAFLLLSLFVSGAYRAR